MSVIRAMLKVLRAILGCLVSLCGDLWGHFGVWNVSLEAILGTLGVILGVQGVTFGA